MTRSNLQNPAQRIELSERQEEVVRLIEKGLTNGEIADRLDLSVDGVKWHVREIFGKLGVDSREEAVARWREERSVSRRARNWAGTALGSMSLKWAGGAVLAGGAGVVGVAAMASAFSAQEPPADEPLVMAAPTATPTPTPPPDIATADGLTMTVHRIQADDTKTVIDISLEGRPELGRFGSPGIGGFPHQLSLTDQSGATYFLRSMGGGESVSRGLTFIFDPVPKDTEWLRLSVADAYFVNPAAETALGERPPDPSATVEGPWLVTITEIPRDANLYATVDPSPRAFGDASVILDEVIQTKDSTVVHAHLEAPTGSTFGRNSYAAATLETESGSVILPTGARRGEGPNEELMRFEFPLTTGPVTLRLQGHGAWVLSEEDVEKNIANQGMTGAAADGFRSIMAQRRLESELAGGTFAGQPPAEWQLLLP